MAGDKLAPVFEAAAVFDGGQNEAAEQAGDCDQKGHPAGLRDAERVIHHRPAPSAVAPATPSSSPSTVFNGEMAGAILCLPVSFPHTRCKTSLVCAVPQRASRAPGDKFRT